MVYATETVENIAEFVEHTCGLKGRLYRGHGKKEWALIPKIARKHSNYEKNIQNLFSILKAHSLDTLLKINLPLHGFDFDYYVEESAYQWRNIVIAQHYGVSTHLLDFTTNPLVACYFAVIEKPKSDGVVWIITPNHDT